MTPYSFLYNKVIQQLFDWIIIMSAPILNRRDIEFFLYEMFNVESLTDREKYQDHDRTSINGAIDTAQSIAEKYYIPIQHKVDANQPNFDGTNIHIMPENKVGLGAVLDENIRLIKTNSLNDYGYKCLFKIIAFLANRKYS